MQDRSHDAILLIIADDYGVAFSHIKELFEFVGGKLDDVVNITKAAQAAGRPILELIEAAKAIQTPNGPAMSPDPTPIEIRIVSVEGGRYHIEFNRPLQYIAFNREGVLQLANDIKTAVASDDRSRLIVGDQKKSIILPSHLNDSNNENFPKSLNRLGLN
jgi:hypothetical protein